MLGTAGALLKDAQTLHNAFLLAGDRLQDGGAAPRPLWRLKWKRALHGAGRRPARRGDCCRWPVHAALTLCACSSTPPPPFSHQLRWRRCTDLEAPVAWIAGPARARRDPPHLVPASSEVYRGCHPGAGAVALPKGVPENTTAVLQQAAFSFEPVILTSEASIGRIQTYGVNVRATPPSHLLPSLLCLPAAPFQPVERGRSGRPRCSRTL